MRAALLVRPRMFAEARSRRGMLPMAKNRAVRRQPIIVVCNSFLRPMVRFFKGD